MWDIKKLTGKFHRAAYTPEKLMKVAEGTYYPVQNTCAAMNLDPMKCPVTCQQHQRNMHAHLSNLVNCSHITCFILQATNQGIIAYDSTKLDCLPVDKYLNTDLCGWPSIDWKWASLHYKQMWYPNWEISKQIYIINCSITCFQDSQNIVTYN